MGAGYSRGTVRVMEAVEQGDLAALRAAVEAANNAAAGSNAAPPAAAAAAAALPADDVVNWDAEDPDHASILSQIACSPKLAYEHKGEAIRLVLPLLKPTSIDSRDKRGWTPLHYAAFQGIAAAVSALIEGNADPTVVDLYGRTPALLTQNISHPLGSLCCELLQRAQSSRPAPLYTVAAPDAVAAGTTISVRVTAPEKHAKNDYLQVFVHADEGLTMFTRRGAYAYVPEGTSATVQVPVGRLEPGQFVRVMYVRADVSAPVAASGLVYVCASPDHVEVPPSAPLPLPWVATLDDEPDAQTLMRVNRALFDKIMVFIGDRKTFVAEAHEREAALAHAEAAAAAAGGAAAAPAPAAAPAAAATAATAATPTAATTTASAAAAKNAPAGKHRRRRQQQQQQQQQHGTDDEGEHDGHSGGGGGDDAQHDDGTASETDGHSAKGSPSPRVRSKPGSENGDGPAHHTNGTASSSSSFVQGSTAVAAAAGQSPADMVAANPAPELAKIALEEIPQLEELRFKTCPTFLRDHVFWRTFFEGARERKAQTLREFAPTTTGKKLAPIKVSARVPKIAVEDLKTDDFRALMRVKEIQDMQLDLDERVDAAASALEASAHLDELRFLLVPSRMSELMFWKIYFATRP